MPADERNDTGPIEAEVVGEETQLTPAQASAVAAVADPATLIAAFRYLQQRIPGFTQLTVPEQRAMMSVIYLDPEFAEIVLTGASAWPALKKTLGVTADELREEDEAIGRLEALSREIEVLRKGVDGAIATRRHRLGTTILQIYSIFGTLLKDPAHAHLRPYYEDMKRAYRRRGKKAPKKKGGEPEE